MKGKIVTVALCCAGALYGGGCSTLGNSDAQTTLYDTQRQVTDLDKKLSEKTAELYANVEASSTEQKRLNSLLEENQAQVNAMRKDLNALTKALNAQSSMSGTSVGSAALSNQPEIEPPAGTPAPDPGEYTTTRTVPEPESDTTITINPSPGSSAAKGDSPVAANVSPPPPAGNPEDEYKKAQDAYAKNDYKGALGLFDEFLQLYPKSELSANAQFWKAKCNLDVQDYQTAIREFEVMRSKYPSSTKVPFAMHNQAVAHERLGQIPQAKALLEDVIKNYPVSPAADQAKAGLEKLNKQ